MPSPMYFHPFNDPRHYIGFGPTGMMSLPSWVSLRGVSPTLAKAHYKYLYKMTAPSTTFQAYIDAAHRIYVMGHCSPGSLSLATETGHYETCYTNELVEMFVQHGLPLNSRAHIRIHACNSASPEHGESFASVFFGEMRARGYQHVTVRGYNAKVGVYLGWRWAGVEPANTYAIDFY